MTLPRIHNLGSVNIDHVYELPHFVRPGETLASSAYSRGVGGKGFNQSLALRRAGAGVFHIGRIGTDGEWLRGMLQSEGVDCAALSISDEATGHAVIQVVPGGENAIVLHGGANGDIGDGHVARALASARTGDWFLCQNETSSVAASLRIAREAGLRTAYNAAPAAPDVSRACLEDVDFLFVNETEVAALAGKGEAKAAAELIRADHPHITVVLTLGSAGAMWIGKGQTLHVPASPCEVVDTTAAGDTFTGYCLAALMRAELPLDALMLAARAAALCVSRHGAAASIPRMQELLK
jgi:ribokinase